MWLFNKNNDEKKLQKELHKMDKADEKLAKELAKDLEKRDEKERDYEIDAVTEDEWMIYQKNYRQEAAEQEWLDRTVKDAKEENASIAELSKDVDRYRNKSEQRYKKHMRK